MKNYNIFGKRALLLMTILVVIFVVGCQASIEPTPFPTEINEVANSETTKAAEESAEITETSEPEESSQNAEPTAAPTSTATSPAGTVKPPATPTPASTSTATIEPTATPTSARQFAPNLQITEPQPVREGVATPATAVPTAVPPFNVPSGTTNILLLGSDAPVGDNSSIKRTDTMIIVSINRDGPTAAMVSLPRDLYVYVPGGTMNRLNAAITLGGVELLKQTILYNFGIPIHYYARVDFEGFTDIVDAMDGVELAVSCHFKDWKIKSPELDPEVVENWYVEELEPGIYQMDGETALWYARSRLMSNDFDRGRRQQQLLRAMLNQGVDLGLAAQVPALWSAFQDTVDTDMDIGRLLQIASLAPGIRENGVQNLYVFGKTESWIVPETNAQVQLPIWEGPNEMGETLQRLFLPPALNKATRAPITVEIVNATGNRDLTQLAAENLAWYGFVPVEGAYVPIQEETSLTYYAPNFKGSYDWLIHWVVGVRQSEIILDEETDSDYDYQVILGADYDPCVDQFFAPQSLIP
ncbi:MAG: LCP family protein [Anaerolineales bacterium]|nr:LCP family protein [Anaerolineales bacterium]